MQAEKSRHKERHKAWHKKRPALLIITIICALLAATVLLWLRGCFLPAWISWEERTFTARLIPSDGNDSDPSETDSYYPETVDLPSPETGPASPQTIDLRKRRITVRDESSSILFSSPVSWQVSDVLTRDLDNNGGEELIMLVWKRGSYGTSKPFWVKRDDPGFSQHIFIYTWSEAEGRIRPLWMSSDVGMEIRSWELVPEPERESVDELQEPGSQPEPALSPASEPALNTSEGNTQPGNRNDLLCLTDDKGSKTYWRWENWGLKLAGSEDAAKDNSSGGTVKDTVHNRTELSLLVAGDNIIHPSICAEYADSDKGCYDFTPIYENLKPWISSHDIAVVGQETPLVSDPSMYSGYPDFGTPQAAGDALADAGFDVILGASNHAFDKGLRGLNDTCRFWKEKHPEVTLLGIRSGRENNTNENRTKAEYGSKTGSRDEPEHGSETDTETDSAFSPASTSDCIIEKNGIRLAMFNYTTSLNGHRPPVGHEDCVNYLPVTSTPEGNAESEKLPAVTSTPEDIENDSSGHSYAGTCLSEEEALLVKALQEAEHTADISLVFLHTGTEYAAQPDPETKDLAVRLIDAGTDAVFCSHPHVVQPYEEIRTESGNKGLVFYSLGNFVANQDRPETILGVAVSMRIMLNRKSSQADTASDADTGSGTSQASSSSGSDAETWGVRISSDSVARSGESVETPAFITDYEAVPIVCHFGSGKTRLYFLDDYTDDLASEHYISRRGNAITSDVLKSLWESVTPRKDSIQK